MKILQINKFLYPRGGTETYLLNLCELLEANGHEVIYFSQKNPKNIPAKEETMFLEDLELGKFSWSSILRIGRIFWSFKAARLVTEIIKREKPDLVHIHNIYHQISPSILPAIKKTGTPIVMTAHDFKLIRPEYTLRADNKKIRHKDSWLQQLLLNYEFAFHKWLKIYDRNIDAFIVPSETVKDELTDYGFSAVKIKILPLFIDLRDYPSREEAGDNYIMYFGRLDESKGIDTLISAFGRIDTDARLLIAGAGPQEAELKKLAAASPAAARIELVGKKNKPDLIKLISRSRFTICPSRVKETFGLAVLESFACHKAVIASRAGALTELVADGQNGFLFNVDDSAGLAEKISLLLNDQKLASELGQNARKEAESNKYSPADHLRQLEDIYNEAIEKKSALEKQFALEKSFRAKLLASEKNSQERRQLIKQANNEVAGLINSYSKDGIRGQNDSTFKLITKITARGSKILDYGCGGGELVSLLNQNGYQAWGYEPSTATAESAAKLPANGEKIITDLKTISAGFDLIIMDNVIEHFIPDEVDEIIATSRLLLDPQGKILIITPHRFAGPHDVSRYFLPLGSAAQGLHLHEYTLSELKSLLAKHDFKNLSGYCIHPRLLQKIGLNIRPRGILLKIALAKEKLISVYPLKIFLKINRNTARMAVALACPGIIIGEKQ